MKKQFLTIIGAIILFSCTPSTKKNKRTPTTDVPQLSIMTDSIVKRHITFSGTFYQIVNIGSIDIIYTEGDYNIEAEGPQRLIDAINISVDSHVLTVNMNSELVMGIDQFKQKGSGLILHVSCPELRSFATCSTGGFRSVGLSHIKDIHCGCLGLGSIELDSLLITGNFRYESSGDGNATFKYVKVAGESTMLIGGKGNVDAHFETGNQLTIDNSGTGIVNIHGQAKHTDLTTLTEGLTNLNIITDYLKVSAFKGTVTLKGQFAKKQIHQSKEAKIIE